MTASFSESAALRKELEGKCAAVAAALVDKAAERNADSKVETRTKVAEPCSEESGTFDRGIEFHREAHVKLLKSLRRRKWAVLSVSQPWVVYWSVHGLSVLGELQKLEDVPSLVCLLERCADDEIGGFGGGPGQLAHLACTYAALAALTILKGHEDLQGLHGTLCNRVDPIDGIIEKAKISNFLASVQSTVDPGAFAMHPGGEVDMRGIYCAVASAQLAGISLQSSPLFSQTADYILSCQSYDGAFGGEVAAEGHAGYTYCALAALQLLGQLHRLPRRAQLLRWLLNRQSLVTGGCNGRPNKLEDCCYTFWVVASLEILRRHLGVLKTGLDAHALQAFTLICGQTAAGGFRDKPDGKADLYHTCYSLSGLALLNDWQNQNDLEAGGAKDPKIDMKASSMAESINVCGIRLAKDRFEQASPDLANGLDPALNILNPLQSQFEMQKMSINRA